MDNNENEKCWTDPFKTFEGISTSGLHSLSGVCVSLEYVKGQGSVSYQVIKILPYDTHPNLCTQNPETEFKECWRLSVSRGAIAQKDNCCATNVIILYRIVWYLSTTSLL